jgi:tetratricopeptide (TPR) repeat protein
VRVREPFAGPGRPPAPARSVVTNPPLRTGTRFGRTLLACALAAACAGPAPEGPAPEPAVQPEAAAPSAVLDRLAEEALDRGELDVAEARFRRLARARPDSPRGHAGLGRVALARGDRSAARRHFDAALAADPDDVDARFGLAEVERQEGDRGAALAHLRRALARDPSRPEIHARLAELTGPAPRGDTPSPPEALRLAEAHPYDPWALLGAAEALQRAGRSDAARGYLEKAVWLADLDPASATEAARRLAVLDGESAGFRVVPVHLYADESIRARIGWRFRLRMVLAWVSNALHEILQTRFVPASIGAFRSARVSDDLQAIDLAFRRGVREGPEPGIRAAFTDRPMPQRTGIRKRGLAEFLGRNLTVRLEPGSVESRVLAHEILHLYGAMHVTEAVDSLMNPEGASMQLDRASYGIVRATRKRTFRGGGPNRDLLPWIDLDETIAAYEAALALNLTFRKLGLQKAREAQRVSRYQAANQAREAIRMDEHLADVLALVSTLLQADARPVEALRFLESAAALYGPDTSRGRRTAASAERLRRQLLRAYDIE